MIDFISLNEIDLYTKIKSLHQIEFPIDYKLIADYNEDTINNSEYPGKKLTEFISTLARIDVPTFFVTIKTNYEHIHRDLAHLNSIYKNGVVNVVASDETFKLIQEKKNVFCIYPWMHFYFNPQGQINSCCVADNLYPLGDYRKSIDFNSKDIVKFRTAILNNQPVPQCTHCYVKEEQNLSSERQQANIKFGSYRPDVLTAHVEDFRLRYVDIRLSNVCNLKCRMCSGKFSSKIAEEDYKIWGDTEFLHNNNNENENNILALVEEQINNIEHVYFAGGEPLVNQTHYKILDLLIKHNRKNVEITYNTNFSLLKYKKHNVLEYWKQFNNVRIGASIDLIGSASNYVRNGVEYYTFEDNYRQLIKTCPTARFTITSVLSLYNIFNLCQLQQHWINNIRLPWQNITFSILVSPDFLSIQVLPDEFKQKAVEHISKHINYLSTIGATSLVNQWQNAIAHMNSQDNSHLLDEFFKLGDIRDQHRKQKFENVFPEYAGLRQCQ